MEEMFKEFASYIALGVEVISALVIAYGAIEAVYGLLTKFLGPKQVEVEPLTRRKKIFLQFGACLILGLEFELAADVVRSAISPS